MAYRLVSKTSGLTSMRVRLPPCPPILHPGSGSERSNMPIIIATLLFTFLGLLTVFVLFFVSRRASPIPYFPSNHKDIPLILKLLALRNGQILYDLGAGDGVVVFRAAAASPASSPLPRQKAGPTKFTAVEINPILIAIMKLRRLLHPNKSNIKIIKGDIFMLPIPRPLKYTPIFFMYISPWYMEKTILNLLKQFKSIDLVTYFYAVPKSNRYKIKLVTHAKNIHDVYRYTITRTK